MGQNIVTQNKGNIYPKKKQPNKQTNKKKITCYACFICMVWWARRAISDFKSLYF